MITAMRMQVRLAAMAFTIRHTVLAMAFAVAALQAPAASGAEFDHAHAHWNTLLARHVRLENEGRASRVHYAGFAANRAELDTYLSALSRVTPAQFSAWTKAEQAAFLINSYNAHTISLILTRYPELKSIRDLGNSLLSSPWKRKFFMLLGKDRSLDEIEHEMLRRPGVYNEPRVHFAVNCASVGCPMLREEAYVASRLDAQLDEQARRFLSDAARNRYDPVRNELWLSQIFNWYADDFTSGQRGLYGKDVPARSIVEYYARHAPQLLDSAPARNAFIERRPRTRFIDYDWALNGAAH